jgi:hypothetical protein
MRLKKSSLISGIITFSLWTIFTIVVILVPVKSKEEKKDFVTVSIKLPPMEEIVEKEDKIEPTPIPVEEPKIKEVQKTEEKPVIKESDVKEVQKTVEPKVEQKTESKTQQKQEVKPKAEEKFTPVKQELQKSVDELMAEQNAAKPKKSVDEVDWSAMFETDLEPKASSSKESSEKQHIGNNSDSLVGKAGSGTSVANKSASSSTTDNDFSNNTPTNTESFLSSVSEKKYESETSSLKSSVEIDSVLTKDTVVISMDDGKLRNLIFPKQPTINLPENAQIDASLEITIYFLVKADGSVPYTEIKISNEALLSLEIVNSIKNQLSEWRFDSSDGDGHGRFNYSIIKK